MTAASLPFSFWNTAFSLGTLLKSTRLHSSSSDTTKSGFPAEPHPHQKGLAVFNKRPTSPRPSTSLGNADWHDLPGQHAGLVRRFAAAVRANGVGVLLLPADAAGLRCVLCTIALQEREQMQNKQKKSNKSMRNRISHHILVMGKNKV